MAYYYIVGVTTTTATVFAGGVTGIAGRGPTIRVTFGGTWASGDKYSMQLVTPSVTYQLGVGNLTGIVPTACLTLSSRVHFIAGASWYGSDNNDATGWETQSPGAFKINCSNNFKSSETLVSLAAYQGRMALYANNTIQIWFLNADPTQITISQVLANIGTYCPLGPQSIGDLDVIFPSLTGFRSLRVRDSSSNAFVNDLGSPVDLLIQNDIVTVGFSNLASKTCSIVEPTANRYWHYINGTIYVLSYFPAAKIPAAWSQYLCQYYVSSTLTTFVPSKFVLYNQQVFILGAVSTTNHIFNYGYDSSGVQHYDATTATIASPWYDLGDSGMRKAVTGIDWDIQGSWQFFGSMDYNGVANNAAPLQAITSSAVAIDSFQFGQEAWTDDGFHVMMQAKCSTAAYSVLSAIVIHYEDKAEK